MIDVCRTQTNGSRAAVTSKMECFVIIVNGFQQLQKKQWHQIMLTYLWTILSRSYCAIIFKKLIYHLWYGFVLLMIFSSYGPVRSTCRIISFPSHRITVNPRRNLKLNSKFISSLTKFTLLIEQFL